MICDQDGIDVRIGQQLTMMHEPCSADPLPGNYIQHGAADIAKRDDFKQLR
jgi:hypothetical protein